MQQLFLKGNKEGKRIQRYLEGSEADDEKK